MTEAQPDESPKLFDLGAARAARDEAVDRVERNADEDWETAARRALFELAKELGADGEFTTDDVHCDVDTHENRAWGAVVRRAARAGFIVNTGRTRQSSSRVCHARPKTVWRVTELIEAYRQ